LVLVKERLVPLVVACGLFMENLDSTILATALPTIAGALEVSPLRLNLAITAYLFSLAVFIPLSGWVADRFGAKLVFRLAIVVFVLGSIGCGLATSLPWLVAARVLQGLGGAMMVPVGRLLVLRSVPRAGFVNAMAYLTVPALIGPVIGPPLGGFITTYGSWRWIFWINVPVGLLGLLLVTRFVEEVREVGVPPLDLTGFLLSSAAMIGLVVGLETIGRGVVPPAATLGAMLAGAVVAGLYVRHARRTASPILDLGLLGLATFRAALLGGFLFRMGIGALPFLLPLLLQLGFGLSPFHSGLITFSAAAGALTMKFAASRIINRFGFRPVLVGTALIGAVSIAACATFTPATPPALIIVVLLIGGFFRSLQLTSINAVAYADVEPARMSRATSLASTGQQLSLSVGVGTAALILHLTTGGAPEGTLTAAEVRPAFLLVALISAGAALVYARLPRDAAAALTTRRRAVAGPTAEPSPGD